MHVHLHPDRMKRTAVVLALCVLAAASAVAGGTARREIRPSRSRTLCWRTWQ